jgi:hypothetical protein
VPSGSVGAKLCALAGDTIQAALIAHAEAMIGDCGMPLAGRDARINTLEMELRELSFHEETLIQAAFVDGVTIERVNMADVPAMLQIRRRPARVASAIATE